VFADDPWDAYGVTKVRRAGGSRTMLDVLRHPVDVVADPTGSNSSKKHSDLEAIEAGEVIEVSCWLRGDSTELPSKFQQGMLQIGPGGMTWRRYWRHRHRAIAVPDLDRVEEVIRPAGRSTGHRLKRGLFTNVVASGPSGRVELCVPGVGPALVRRAIEHQARERRAEE